MSAEISQSFEDNPSDEEFELNISQEEEQDDDFVERGREIVLQLDPVKAYLQKIGKTALINAEQEVDLAKRIEAGLYAGALLAESQTGQLNSADSGDDAYRNDLSLLVKDGKAAKTHLTEANLRLVVSVAKRYVGNGMMFLDIIQEGNIGLNRAVEKFDYKKGYKFSTYATWWIRQSITRSLADQSKIIRVPVHMNEKVVKYRRVKREMLQNTGREPTIAEIVEEMGESEKLLHEIIKVVRQEPSSLNELIGDTGGRGNHDTELADLVHDESAVSPFEQVDQLFIKVALNKVLDTLPVREADIIRMRFGLDGGDCMTLDEIGKEFDLTRERIRQIQIKAMSKLRNGHNTQQLRTLLDNL